MQKTHVGLSDVLLALSFGLAFSVFIDAVAVNVFGTSEKNIQRIMYIYSTQSKYDACHEDAIGQNTTLISLRPSTLTNHPNNTLFNFGPSGPDFSCTSQLDL